MRKYLQPSQHNQTKEESQLVFKLRSRMTDLKTNYKGIYDDYGCSACGKADESQSHILECEELQSRNEEIYESLKFENIFDGNVKEQLKIARIFKQNMKIKEEMEKIWENSTN